uniref:Methionine aminopeptidase n=1 Tax=Timspurckia oligopyrenoides TaxID=708627 RepID=A0A7S0ZCV3_9RHOD
MECATLDCSKSATLRCPTCIKLGISDSSSYFCSQECFKTSWKAHKSIHTAATVESQLKRNLDFKNFQYTGTLRAGNLSTPRIIPASISKPDYARTGVSKSEESARRSARIRQLSESEIVAMRKVCRLAREVLDEAASVVKVGVTTDEIDKIVHEACIARDSYPSPLNYYHFPKSCCTSVNEVICHGIPDDRPLQNGDIVNIDITLYHGGFHGDLNETYTVGEVDEESRLLIKSAYDSMHAAIASVKPGVLYREFGGVIEKVAKSNKHQVVRTYCGHGINDLFHCAPNVPHYKNNKAVGVCKPGHTFTIEPMLTIGTWRDVTWPDEWTSVTADGKRSAQFEHTLLVTEHGVEILTARLPTSPKFWWE